MGCVSAGALSICCALELAGNLECGRVRASRVVRGRVAPYQYNSTVASAYSKRSILRNQPLETQPRFLILTWIWAQTVRNQPRFLILTTTCREQLETLRNWLAGYRAGISQSCTANFQKLNLALLAILMYHLGCIGHDV